MEDVATSSYAGGGGAGSDVDGVVETMVWAGEWMVFLREEKLGLYMGFERFPDLGGAEDNESRGVKAAAVLRETVAIVGWCKLTPGP